MFPRTITLVLSMFTLAACGPDIVSADTDDLPPELTDIDEPATPSDEGGDEAGGGWGGEDPEPLTAELVLPDMPEDTEPLSEQCCRCGALSSGMFECLPMVNGLVIDGSECAPVAEWGVCQFDGNVAVSCEC